MLVISIICILETNVRIDLGVGQQETIICSSIAVITLPPQILTRNSTEEVVFCVSRSHETRVRPVKYASSLFAPLLPL